MANSGIHKSIGTIMSYEISSWHIVELLASYRTVLAYLKDDWRCNLSFASLIIMSIVSPKSTKVFCMRFLLICTFTIGLSGSSYLRLRTLPNIRSTRFLMTLIVGGFFFILPSLLIQYSLMNLLYMGTSLMV